MMQAFIMHFITCYISYVSFAGQEVEICYKHTANSTKPL